MRLLLSVFFVMSIIPLVLAQAGRSDYLGTQAAGKKGIIYSKETTFDITPHTKGFALGMSFGKIRTYYKTYFYKLEIGELRHPREQRQSFDLQSFNGKVSKSFVFGKQNSLYVIRGSYGLKRYYSEKAKERGLAVGTTFSVGPTLGLLKPYYLELIRRQIDNPVAINIVAEKYSESNKSLFLDTDAIYGGTGLTKGWGEIKVSPGVHFKSALLLDWGAFDEMIKSVEIGVMADLFLRPVPIMVTQDNSPLFLNFYLNLQLGKRK
ncbi:MAG: hypothetical protein KA198_10275 [Chitinophagaceae bacterium]|nr:hypothetical protein [Chitinophagaceae bacterium]